MTVDKAFNRPLTAFTVAFHPTAKLHPVVHRN
jgi:hypothetical protein